MRSIAFKHNPKHSFFSKIYARIVGKPFFMQYVTRVKFKEYIKKIKFNDVLDLGCADGEYAFYLEHKYPNAKIIGIDSYEKEIKNCILVKDKIKSNVDFRFAEIGSLEEKFDLILLMGVLSFNLKDKELVKKIDGHLNKEGILFIKDSYSENVESSEKYDKKFLKARKGYNKQRILDLLEGTSLELMKYERFNGGITRRLVELEDKVSKSYILRSLLYIVLRPFVYISLKFFDKSSDGKSIICIVKKK